MTFPHFFLHPNLNNTKENGESATPGFQGAQWRGRSPKATSAKAHQVPFSSSSSRRQRPPLPIRGTAARNGLTCHFTTWKLNSPCLILPPAIVPSVKWASDASSGPSVQTYGAVETLEDAEDTLLLVSLTPWPSQAELKGGNSHPRQISKSLPPKKFLVRSETVQWCSGSRCCLVARRVCKEKIINTYKN